MYLFEWTYNHIIRATGASALGIAEMSASQKQYADNDAEIQEITQKEAKYHIQTIKRLFILTRNYTQNKIDSLQRNASKKRVSTMIEKLQAIKNDCDEMIKSFEHLKND